MDHGLELGERLPELAEQGVREAEPDERLRHLEGETLRGRLNREKAG